ncbi:hypothetical protein AZ023_003063, partial [Klebsiella pneumoniae]
PVTPAVCLCVCRRSSRRPSAPYLYAPRRRRR